MNLLHGWLLTQALEERSLGIQEMAKDHPGVDMVHFLARWPSWRPKKSKPYGTAYAPLTEVGMARTRTCCVAGHRLRACD
jgi:hypothetical protein